MKVDIKQIKPNPKNPRVIKDANFDKLKQSIQEFPEMLEKRPLVCYTDTDNKLVVLGGNMRLKAAKDLGIHELPVILADDWTAEQKEQFIIRDNVSGGEWDWEALTDWEKGELAEWGVDVPEFDIDNENELKDLSSDIKNLFRIEIICQDEEHQETSYNKLIEQGYECRLLTL